MFNHFVDRLNQTNMINNHLHNTQLVKYNYESVDSQQGRSPEKKGQVIKLPVPQPEQPSELSYLKAVTIPGSSPEPQTQVSELANPINQEVCKVQDFLDSSRSTQN